MRTILFRGKRIDNGEWVEGDLITLVTPDFKPSESALILPKNSYSFNDTISCVAKSVGQFTGLTDRNGKRIFEGDVLEKHEDFYTDPADIGGRRHIKRDIIVSIKWGRYCYVRSDFESPIDPITAMAFEIIGNITDNPELIKQ